MIPQPLSVSSRFRPTGGPDSYRFELPPAEWKTVRKRKPISPAAWAERHRVVTMSRVSGLWRNSTNRYLEGILEASFFRSVRDITICAGPQGGKSEVVNTAIGYVIDRQPGPVLYVYPDEMTARENSQDRIQPMITESTLASYQTGVADDMADFRIRLQNCVLYFAWARSAARLANKPIRYLVLDETDKYPEYLVRETDPISLAEKRLSTYSGEEIVWRISTPTIKTGPIWQSVQRAQVCFEFRVRCPDCGRYQRMELGRIRVPDDIRDPDQIETERLARYHCAHCESIWSDEIRNLAVSYGEWRDPEHGLTVNAYLRSYQPVRIAFHIPAWLFRFVSLSKCLASFFRGQKDRIAMRDFRNAIEALPWEDYAAIRAEDAIVALKDDRPAGQVPPGGVVAGLVAGIDTQDFGFWYEIRAFGFGLESESWQVRFGFVETFDGLAQILWADQYGDPSGKKHLIQLAGIDAMGHRTDEVYRFCLENRGRIFPIQGAVRLSTPYNYSNLEFFPGGKKPIPGGLKLLRLNVTYYKNALSRKLDIQPGDPGAWHMCADMTDEWASHMVSEVENEKGEWVVRDNMPNHGWDCSVYALAVADVLGIKHWSRRAPAAKAAPAAPSGPNPFTGGRSVWR